MAEIQREGLSRFWRADGPAGLVANTARSDVSAARLGTRAVAGKARGMGIQTGRNGKSNTPPCRLVACRAIRLPRMLRMVEYGIEASQSRKWFNARGRVTDRADRMLVAFGELLLVAGGTRYMSRITDRGAVVVSDVADKTGHPLMLLCLVPESRIVLCGRFGHFVRHKVVRFAAVAKNHKAGHYRQDAGKEGYFCPPCQTLA